MTPSPLPRSHADQLLAVEPRASSMTYRATMATPRWKVDRFSSHAVFGAPSTPAAPVGPGAIALEPLATLGARSGGKVVAGLSPVRTVYIAPLRSA